MLPNIDRINTEGVFRLERNLYLQVTLGAHGINKSWLYRYSLNGKARSMGLGTYPRVGAAEARFRAEQAYKMIRGGLDPLAERDEKRKTAKAKTANKIAPVQGCIYFIGDGDFVKIGFSGKVKSRLRDLQVGHPRNLELLAALPAFSHIEHTIHKRFAHLRVRPQSEWFTAAPELKEYIAEIAKNEAA